MRPFGPGPHAAHRQPRRLQLRQVPRHAGEPGRVSRLARERGARAMRCATRRRRFADVDPPDSIGAKKCPKCRSLMSKYRISADKTNRLDYCPHCEEIWLDDGEWQLVEGLVIAGDFTRVFTQAWQYAVRAGISHGDGRAASARVVRRATTNASRSSPSGCRRSRRSRKSSPGSFAGNDVTRTTPRSA